VLGPVASYYTARLREFGAEARGVDWNSVEGQELRFAQLCRILPTDRPFVVRDVGCGYGALVGYLKTRYREFRYEGIDVSEAMVDAARARNAAVGNASFAVGSEPLTPVDYSVASGIFNVRLQATDSAWKAYVRHTLTAMDRNSIGGFAFNCLTSYSDPDRMRDDLNYADPCELFDLCKRSFSRNVALLHDYGLYEFTILVRKNPEG
jgi:SAM-dependent methyltransferase